MTKKHAELPNRQRVKLSKYLGSLKRYREGSGRELDSRLRGRGFEPHRHHCVVSLTGLENSTRPLVFTSTSGCRASENFAIFSENYFFSYICQ